MNRGIQSHSLHVSRIYSERPITIPMCTMRIDMKDMIEPPLAGRAHCFHTDPDRHCDKQIHGELLPDCCDIFQRLTSPH